MRRFILALTVLVLAGQISWAEELVPATSDDLKEFDQQVSKAKAEDSAARQEAQKSAEHRKDGDHSMREKRAKKDNFGSLVSAEAKKLKDESSDKRKEMGKWVSDQRRKSGQDQAGSGEQHGSSGSSGDSQHSSPANNNRGGDGSSEHGNSGNHKK